MGDEDSDDEDEEDDDVGCVQVALGFRPLVPGLGTHVRSRAGGAARRPKHRRAAGPPDRSRGNPQVPRRPSVTGGGARPPPTTRGPTPRCAGSGS